MTLSKVVAASILIALLVPIHALAFQPIYPNWSVFEHQPNLRQGGRTNAVAINPEDSSEMFAASDSGGLFKSEDGGLTWKHIHFDTLPVIFTQSVIYLPSDPTVVLVSAKADFKDSNGGGVWRSVNGGMTWDPAPLEPTTAGRLSAYGLSAVDSSVVVGTSEGIFASTDGGASWTPSSPFSGTGDPRVYSVLLTPGVPMQIYAGGPSGVRLNKLTIPFAPWVTPPPNAIGELRSIHALGGSALSADHAFVTNGERLFRTEDKGITWLEVAGAPPGSGLCNGTPFIKTALLDRDTSKLLHLFYGNGCDAHRLLVPVVQGVADYSGMWQAFIAEHFPRDLAVVETEPVLLASNGGLHNTQNGGLNWAFVGGGIGGYNALQITDLTGQRLRKSLRTDVYFGTQDNNIWVVDDQGDSLGGLENLPEGFFFGAEPQINRAEDSRITYAGCGPCRPRVANRRLQMPRDINHSPILWAAPVLIRPGQRIQNVMKGLDITADPDLMAFQPFASFPEEPRGLPKVGVDGADTLVYQAHRWGPYTRLLRIKDSAGIVDVERPVMDQFGSLGINRLMGHAWDPVFGVDPWDASHLIAVDTSYVRMARSTTSADDWHGMPDLTNDVTYDGDLLFTASVPDFGTSLPLVTAISFFPGDPSQVLLGTAEGGIYYSGNRGATWGRINSSRPVTYVTSFFWSSLNTVYVSSFGRGIWRLHNQPTAGPESFGDLCPGCDVVSTDGPGRPDFDNSVLVFDGEVLGVRREKLQLREVFVTPGSSYVFTGDPKDLQEDILITESEGKETFEPLPKPPDGWIVTGVVFTSDDVLTGAAFAESELSLMPPKK